MYDFKFNIFKPGMSFVSKKDKYSISCYTSRDDRDYLQKSSYLRQTAISAKLKSFLLSLQLDDLVLKSINTFDDFFKAFEDFVRITFSSVRVEKVALIHTLQTNTLYQAKAKHVIHGQCEYFKVD